MTKKTVIITMAIIACLYNAEVLYGASFGDMFGGKKSKKTQALLEQKAQECQAKVNEIGRDNKRLVDEKKDSEDAVQALRDKNNTLMEAYEKVITDQTNIVEQLTRLRRENQRCGEIKENYDAMTQENQAFLQANESLDLDKKALMVTLETLKSHISSLNAENEQLSVHLKEEQEDEHVKVKKIKDQVKNEIENLKNRTGSLTKENDVLARQLKKSQKKIRNLSEDQSRVQRKLELSRDDLAVLQKEYAGVKDENRYLAREASEFPKKFTDLARHNRKLVKETGHMHYNMGVSFIKAKEYKRAVKEFKKVLELDPNDAFANYNLGYVYAEHLVDRPAAIEYFQNYLLYAKDAKDADWVKKYILTWQTWYGKEKLK